MSLTTCLFVIAIIISLLLGVYTLITRENDNVVEYTDISQPSNYVVDERPTTEYQPDNTIKEYTLGDPFIECQTNNPPMKNCRIDSSSECHSDSSSSECSSDKSSMKCSSDKCSVDDDRGCCRCKSGVISGFSEVSFEKKIAGNVSVVGGNSFSGYTTINQLKGQCFSSIIEFCYDSVIAHKAIYTITDVDDLWSSVLQGVATVEIDCVQSVNRFVTAYNNTTKIMTFYVENNNNNVIDILAGSKVSVTLILYDCLDVPVNSQNTPNFQFSPSNIGVMSR